MATELSKPVTREVPVTDGVVAVTITSDGVTLRGKGTQREVKVGWEALAAAAEAPPNMPAKFSSNKLGWLTHKVKKDEE